MAIQNIAEMSDMLKFMILSVLFFTKPLIFFYFKDFYKRDKIRLRKTYADRLPPSTEKGIHQFFENIYFKNFSYLYSEKSKRLHVYHTGSAFTQHCYVCRVRLTLNGSYGKHK